MNNEANESFRPEFIELLDSFKEQLNCMDANSSVIFERLNSIKGIREPQAENPKENDNPCGFINEFRFCINKMSEYNNILEKSKNVLIRLVG